jgi:hypothetical protein
MRCCLLGALLLVACSHTTHPTVAPAHVTRASVEDCKRVYDHLLDVTLNNEVDPNHTIAAAQRYLALEDIDVIYRMRGNTETFFNACVGIANPEQIECMSQAEDLDKVSLCAHLFNHPSQN